MKTPKTTSRPGGAVALPVTGRYQALGPKRRGRQTGPWRQYIEDALSDARAMGVGSSVVSENGVVLARFENAAKFVAAAAAEDEVERPRKRPRSLDAATSVR
jgi:hypothetical protein